MEVTRKMKSLEEIKPLSFFVMGKMAGETLALRI